VRVLRERIAFVLGCLVGGAWFLFCSALGIVWLLLSPGNRQTLYMYGRVFCRGLVRLMGWKIDVANRERLDTERPCVFVANHQSFLDVVTFGSIFPPRTVSAGKREIGRIPIFGWFYRLSGNLVIDRDHPRGALASLEAAADAIRREKLSVWFMPEGHRNWGGELLPFKSGAFRLARAAGVPVVPIVAAPLTVLADTKRFLARRGTLRIRVLESVSVDEKSADGISEAVSLVRARMREALEALAGDVVPIPHAASETG
jgi:1-acyl-sn-glycerol-3-phosphate acyltransferase